MYRDVLLQTPTTEDAVKLGSQVTFREKSKNDRFRDEVALGFRIEVHTEQHLVRLITDRRIYLRETAQEQHVTHSTPKVTKYTRQSRNDLLYTTDPQMLQRNGLPCSSKESSTEHMSTLFELRDRVGIRIEIHGGQQLLHTSGTKSLERKWKAAGTHSYKSDFILTLIDVKNERQPTSQTRMASFRRGRKETSAFMCIYCIFWRASTRLYLFFYPKKSQNVCVADRNLLMISRIREESGQTNCPLAPSPSSSRSCTFLSLYFPTGWKRKLTKLCLILNFFAAGSLYWS